MIIRTQKKRPCITVHTNEKKSEPNQGGNTVNMCYEFADSLHAKSYKNTRERGLTVDQEGEGCKWVPCDTRESRPRFHTFLKRHV